MLGRGRTRSSHLGSRPGPGRREVILSIGRNRTGSPSWLSTSPAEFEDADTVLQSQLLNVDCLLKFEYRC